MGSTHQTPGRGCVLAAHPHVCGEHGLESAECLFIFGSSPRVWGALGFGVSVPSLPRLIPTCVGSTLGNKSWTGGTQAHPHVCGEHTQTPPRPKPSLGSSPRVWGAPRHQLQGIRNTRLIPTCVGSTGTPGRTAPQHPAHPHVCGEHLKSPLADLSQTGSSPRVWGAPIERLPGRHERRLIPTCVGSTRPRLRFRPKSSAHPHVCGEHITR